MSVENPNPESRTAYEQPNRPRYTKDDALSDREFQLLLEGAAELEDYYAQQARFAILVMGRLGLRRAELSHLRAEWADFRRNMISIPRYDPCDQGRDDAICGDCRLKARQMADHNEEIALDEALEWRWQPKTEAAARDVPFDFDPRVDLVVERFLDRYDGWPLSSQAVNRRVKAAAELADELDSDDVYPHALRATAASYHANRGLDAIPLQALFGWAQLSTAQHYVASSGENTARALHSVHSR